MGRDRVGSARGRGPGPGAPPPPRPRTHSPARPAEGCRRGVLARRHYQGIKHPRGQRGQPALWIHPRHQPARQHPPRHRPALRIRHATLEAVARPHQHRAREHAQHRARPPPRRTRPLHRTRPSVGRVGRGFSWPPARARYRGLRYGLQGCAGGWWASRGRSAAWAARWSSSPLPGSTYLSLRRASPGTGRAEPLGKARASQPRYARAWAVARGSVVAARRGKGHHRQERRVRGKNTTQRMRRRIDWGQGRGEGRAGYPT